MNTNIYCSHSPIIYIVLNEVSTFQPQALVNPSHWYYEKTWNEADVVPSAIDVWNLNGYLWGLSTDDMQVFVDPTPDCRYSSLQYCDIGTTVEQSGNKVIS